MPANVLLVADASERRWGGRKGGGHDRTGGIAECVTVAVDVVHLAQPLYLYRHLEHPIELRVEAFPLSFPFVVFVISFRFCHGLHCLQPLSLCRHLEHPIRLPVGRGSSSCEFL